MPKEYFKKKGQSNSFRMTNPFKHFVDDNPEHQDTYGDHSDDLQTEEEHLANKRAKKEGTRTHWPDGTKRTEREIHDYDETKTEEGKEAPVKRLGGNVMGATSDMLHAFSKTPSPSMFFYKDKKNKK